MSVTISRPVIYIDDLATPDEIAGIRDEVFNQSVTVRTPHKARRAHGTLTEAVEALARYTPNDGTLYRLNTDLINWFAVDSPGGHVTVWRTGADSAIIETH